jgi:hypothetical protein
MREAERAFQVTDPESGQVQPMAWAAWPGSQPSCAAASADGAQHAMTSQFAGRWPRRTRALWRWRARRGWVITAAIASVVVVVKLTIGFTLVLVLLLT